MLSHCLFIVLQLRLSPEYLELMRIQAIAANAKMYFGPSIPTMFIREGDSKVSMEAVQLKETVAENK